MAVNVNSVSPGDAIFTSNATQLNLQVSMSADEKYYYGDYVRNGYQLKCPTSSDKFTVGTSNGNGALTYPAGNRYWTGTPCNFGVNSTSSSGYIVSSSSYTNFLLAVLMVLGRLLVYPLKLYF